MKQILVTIDTEVGELGKTIPNAFELFVEGAIDGGIYGYKKISEMLTAHGAAGEFFVDVYPTKLFGEEKFASLCQMLVAAGHYVQLHTHPASAFDENRRYLSDYTLEEQKEIIETGIASILRWTGKKPTAHRAGGYGINQDSLIALQQAGILYDSSYHLDNPHCDLPHNHTNQPYETQGLWEVPVTGYTQHLRVKPFGPRHSSFQKLDFRYGSSAQEIIEAITAAPDNSVHTLFLHSFNFLELQYNWKRKEYRPIVPRPDLIAEFETLLSWIEKQPDCTFSHFDSLNLAELAPDYLVDVTTYRPLIPEIKKVYEARVHHTTAT